MKLTRSFDSKEFDSPDSPGSGVNMDYEFMSKLQSLRDDFGHPMVINSGYRTEKHNKAVGGVSSSQHLLGKAADINTQGWDANKKYKFLSLAFELKFTGIGIYKSNFIHLDTRSTGFSMWVGQ